MTSKNGEIGRTIPTIEPSEPGPVASEKPRPLRILVAVPTHGSVKSGFAIALARAAAHFAALPYDGEKAVIVTSVGSSILPEGRARLVARAYDADATHIMWFDADMKFPDDIISRLLNHNLAVVGVNYPRKNIEARPTAYADTPDYVGPVWSGDRASGIQEVSIVGFGALLCDMRVFDQIELPFFAFEPQAPDFVKTMGEDVYFCRKLHKAGIPVHIDHDLSKQVAHIGDFEYTNFLSKEAEVVKQKLYADLPA